MGRKEPDAHQQRIDPETQEIPEPRGNTQLRLGAPSPETSEALVRPPHPHANTPSPRPMIGINSASKTLQVPFFPPPPTRTCPSPPPPQDPASLLSPQPSLTPAQLRAPSGAGLLQGARGPGPCRPRGDGDKQVQQSTAVSEQQGWKEDKQSGGSGGRGSLSRTRYLLG